MYFDRAKKYTQSTKTRPHYMDALLWTEASRIHSLYLWRVHSNAHGGPSRLYYSTVTAPTRQIAIIIVRQCLSIIARILANRSSGILVVLGLRSGKIRRGRLAGLGANGIHDSGFSTAFSDSCASNVVNHGSASAPLTTTDRKGQGMSAVRAHASKTILSTAGTKAADFVFRGWLSFWCADRPTSSGKRTSASTPRGPPRGPNFRPPVRPNCCDNNEL